MISKKKRILTFISLSPFLAVTLLVLYFYIVAALSGFKGRKGGYQDAFRHTYASAVVARYVSPKAVYFVTHLTEGQKKYSTHNRMDIHNNMLGVSIGLSTANIYQSVFNKVSNATEYSKNENESYILPKAEWSNGF